MQVIFRRIFVSFSKLTLEIAERFRINKKKAGIFQPTVCIGETNAMNLELFLAPDYYQATLERYEEIKESKFMILYKNVSLQTLLSKKMVVLILQYKKELKTVYPSYHQNIR